MSHFILTARDTELLEFLAAHRECALTLLAERFFKKNPYGGAENKDPGAACQRRLTKLKREGYVTFDRIRERDGRVLSVVRVGRRADSPLGEAASRRSIAPRDRPHHAKTLEAVRRVEELAARRGKRVVSFQVESAIRALEQRGRRTSRGDTFDSFPDAVCVIEVAGKNGKPARRNLAVEYVTSKYTDKDIAAKLESFRKNYDDVVWYADTPRTVRRVMKITGGACTLLP